MVTSGLLEMDESVGRENDSHETDGRLYSLSTRGILENYVVIKTILEKLEKVAGIYIFYTYLIEAFDVIG